MTDNYLYNIPIINIENIYEIKNLDKSYLDYDNIIVNYKSSKICDKYIKISYSELVNNEYELIQLQNSCDAGIDKEYNFLVHPLIDL